MYFLKGFKQYSKPNRVDDFAGSIGHFEAPLLSGFRSGESFSASSAMDREKPSAVSLDIEKRIGP